MTARTKHWQNYEEVAQFLLNAMATKFGLGRVEGKQVIAGQSGTEWEIDAKGVLRNAEGFVIIECRRRTQKRLSQEEIAGLAYRIQDTGARGGITVSPLDLQSGAKLIAASENIKSVRLSPKSTTTDYVLQFLNNIFVGLTCGVTVTPSLSIKVLRADGTIE